MDDSSPWIGGGGLGLAILYSTGKYFLNKINESLKRIIQLEKEKAVTDAEQNKDIEYILKEINDLKHKIYK